MLKQRGSSTKWKILKILMKYSETVLHSLIFIVYLHYEFNECDLIMNVRKWNTIHHVARAPKNYFNPIHNYLLVLITLLKIRHSTKGGIPDTDSWKRSLSLTKQLNLQFFFSFHKDDKPRKQPKISCISTTRTRSMVSILCVHRIVHTYYH